MKFTPECSRASPSDRIADKAGIGPMNSLTQCRPLRGQVRGRFRAYCRHSDLPAFQASPPGTLPLSFFQPNLHGHVSNIDQLLPRRTALGLHGHASRDSDHVACQRFRVPARWQLTSLLELLEPRGDIGFRLPPELSPLLAGLPLIPDWWRAPPESSDSPPGCPRPRLDRPRPSECPAPPRGRMSWRKPPL